MPRILLDTNILIRHFRVGLQPYSRRSSSDAAEKARQLIGIRKTRAIASPVLVEFLAGVCDSHEMKLAEAFLAEFEVVDGQTTLPVDWQAATDYSRRIPPEGGPRQLGDALLFAIARRLRYEIDSSDRILTRQQGRTRRSD